VRLRIDLVAKFIKAVRPDVLCLQETKCPDDRFPLKRFKRLGYEHAALNGQKGYHGVAVLSRLPFESFVARDFCDKKDCRHIAAVLGERAGLPEPVTVHNFYVRPAAIFRTRSSIRNSPTSSPSSTRCARTPHCDRARTSAPSWSATSTSPPLEHDVWSHKQMLPRRLAHADRMPEAHRGAADRRLGRCHAAAGAGAGQALHLVELPRARLGDGQQRRRLDHIWVAPTLAERLATSRFVTACVGKSDLPTTCR